ARDGVALNAGHKELIGAGFDDRLLVVESGNPGTRQHPSVALSAQQLQQRIEVGEVRGERECASQRVAREADNRVARTDSHRSALGRERVDVEAGIGRQLPDGVSALAALQNGSPVDARLVSVAQLYLDDLGFEYDLPSDRFGGLVDVVRNVAQLSRHGVNDDHTGLAVDHDTAARLVSHDGAEIRRDTSPEVGVSA